MKELYSYIFEVKDSTEKIINSLSYNELKKKISKERKEYLKSLNVVSDDENTIWLVCSILDSTSVILVAGFKKQVHSF